VTQVGGTPLSALVMGGLRCEGDSVRPFHDPTGVPLIRECVGMVDVPLNPPSSGLYTTVVLPREVRTWCRRHQWAVEEAPDALRNPPW